MAKPSAAHYRKPPPIKEIGLHMSAAAFLRRAWPGHLPWWHTPNGEKRDPGTARKLKAMGVLAGVFDFILMMPNGQPGFIELKTDDGVLTDEQIAFRSALCAIGCACVVVRSLDELEAVIIRWLALFGMKPTATVMKRAA